MDMQSGSASQFPPGFFWGSATSSHQIEGDNSLNDWWEWEQAGHPAEPSGKACDSYRRYEEDFDLARSLNQNSHRFSIEWSRIQPQENSWDDGAIDHYRKVVLALRARGIEPVVTLHHFTNPQWFAKKNGWESPDAPRLFAAYARKMAEALAPHVTYWCTINEPMVFIYQGYLAKYWPPGKKTLFGAIRATGRMAQAHIESYRAIHQVYRQKKLAVPRVGVAHAMQVFEPLRPASIRDRLACFVRESFNNRLFLKLIEHSAFYLPAYFFGTGGRQKTMDFIGVNYYFREILSSKTPFFELTSLAGEVCRTDSRYLQSERSDLEWEVYPPGLRQVLNSLKPFRVPVMVTENGICTSDEGLRERFIRDHLAQTLKAIGDGVPVIGYHYWSLLDNFEWSFGFKPRFGLIHVDFATQKRTVKESAYAYAKICKTGSLV